MEDQQQEIQENDESQLNAVEEPTVQPNWKSVRANNMRKAQAAKVKRQNEAREREAREKENKELVEEIQFDPDYQDLPVETETPAEIKITKRVKAKPKQMMSEQEYDMKLDQLNKRMKAFEAKVRIEKPEVQTLSQANQVIQTQPAPAPPQPSKSEMFLNMLGNHRIFN